MKERSIQAQVKTRLILQWLEMEGISKIAKAILLWGTNGKGYLFLKSLRTKMYEGASRTLVAKKVLVQIMSCIKVLLSLLVTTKEKDLVALT